MTRTRPHSVSLWLSDAENSAFKRRHTRDKIRPSTIVRALIADYAAGRNTAPAIRTELAGLRHELRKIGINLNQVLHVAHTEALRDQRPDLVSLLKVTALLIDQVNRLAEQLSPYVESAR